ncbi:helix-turn-helix domain-containing protein [Corynebacterium variabile]|uniref:helix-turn-helix domain-containing protein n=1 Tax=Corynebacterium variabile TaxID=1727 RepID=UPI003F8F1A72
MMRISELKTHRDMENDRRSHDPEYAAETNRLALADAVSTAVVAYRGRHNMTQTRFADMLGWKQPHVARLERGDVTPSLESLERLARAGVIEVHLDQTGTVVRELETA